MEKKTINTLRGEAWDKLNKLAKELQAAGDIVGAEIIVQSMLKIGAL